MRSKPVTDKVNRRALRTETLPMKSTTEMISDETVTCLTIQTLQALVASRVGRVLDNKSKINGDALRTGGRNARGGLASISLGELSMEADRAFLQFIRKTSLGHTINSLVQIIHGTRVQVA
jgi:hypothetical protein